MAQTKTLYRLTRGERLLRITGDYSEALEMWAKGQGVTAVTSVVSAKNGKVLASFKGVNEPAE